jgi:ABC-2 type transport system ATP-binding protein
VVRADGPRRWLAFDREAVSAARLIGDVAERYALRDLTIEEPRIEDIIRRIYQEGI